MRKELLVLLLTATLLTACRAIDEQKDAILRAAAASVLAPVAELQSATPLTQSNFRDAAPVAPKSAPVTATATPAPKKRPAILHAAKTIRPRVIREAAPAPTEIARCAKAIESRVIVIPMG